MKTANSLPAARAAVSESLDSAPAQTVVIADDHPLMQAGLVQVIDNDPEFRVIGQAADGAEAWRLIEILVPTVAVLDVDMPKMNGLQVARAVRQKRLPTGLMLLSLHNRESFLQEALEIGVKGYVLKDNAVVDVLQCLRAVTAGRTYISPSVSSHLVQRAEKARRLLAQKPSLNDLTAMERQVLRLVAGIKTTKEIAAVLFISPFTVETHRRNICQKLDLHGSHRLLQFALEHRTEL